MRTNCRAHLAVRFTKTWAAPLGNADHIALAGLELLAIHLEEISPLPDAKNLEPPG